MSPSSIPLYPLLSARIRKINKSRNPVYNAWFGIRSISFAFFLSNKVFRRRWNISSGVGFTVIQAHRRGNRKRVNSCCLHFDTILIYIVSFIAFSVLENFLIYFIHKASILFSFRILYPPLLSSHVTYESEGVVVTSRQVKIVR